MNSAIERHFRTPSPKVSDRELLVEIESLRKEINNGQDERMLELQVGIVHNVKLDEFIKSTFKIQY